MTQRFFQTVQSKMHWAAHGHTAAEVVRKRADAGRPHMGLTTWKNAPKGPVRKGDVDIAKNYLTREEIDALNLIVSAYLDFAELQARSNRPMHMADWISKLDDFLKLSERDILTNAGKISHEAAQQYALNQFEHYEHQRRSLENAGKNTDFDQAIKHLKDERQKPKGRRKKSKNEPSNDEHSDDVE